MITGAGAAAAVATGAKDVAAGKLPKVGAAAVVAGVDPKVIGAVVDVGPKLIGAAVDVDPKLIGAVADVDPKLVGAVVDGPAPKVSDDDDDVALGNGAAVGAGVEPKANVDG
jgi:hypothetical protein